DHACGGDTGRLVVGDRRLAADDTEDQPDERQRDGDEEQARDEREQRADDAENQCSYTHEHLPWLIAVTAVDFRAGDGDRSIKNGPGISHVRQDTCEPGDSCSDVLWKPPHAARGIHWPRW